MALRGINVIELAGLAPAPFCGMVLADFGASVLKIDRMGTNSSSLDCVANGKKSIALNLKHPQGIVLFKQLSKKADVVLEPFRKGVMESLGIGPDVLLKDNPRLIYARLTGYGQNGDFSSRAGHDINYISLTGLLSLFGRTGEKPIFPVNIVADFGGGGLMCALGIILALFERQSSGKGQIVDSSMVEGSAYLGSWLYRSQHLPIWGNQRGQNILDTGAHFYETYETKDGKFVAVGAIEPQFYSKLLKGLGLSEDEVPQYSDFEKSKKIFATKFLEKTRDEWSAIFKDVDACVTPVLTLDEAPQLPHNVQRNMFVKGCETKFVPKPAPTLSRTPGESKCNAPIPSPGQHTSAVLHSLGYTNEDINRFEREGIVETCKSANL